MSSRAAVNTNAQQVAKQGMLVLRLPAHLWNVVGAAELQMPTDGMALEDVASVVAQWKVTVIDTLAEAYADESKAATKPQTVSGNGRAAVGNRLR